DELLIQAQLADLEVHLAIEEGLLEPQLPQPRGILRLDAALRLQRVEVVGAQVAAVDLEGAHVEDAALPAELRRVDADAEHRLAVVVEAGVHAAGDVAENLAGFLQSDRHAVLAGPGAQAEDVAE